MPRILTNDEYKTILDEAHRYSIINSGCRKVAVGSAVVVSTDTEYYNLTVAFGANRAIPNACMSTGCMRVQKYGEDSKNHRLPSDCRAIHSEIDAIIQSKTSLDGGTIVITRYPCEACARAIVAAGISVVVYGRKQEISSETRQIFEMYDVTCIHIEDWDAEDTTR